jgi:hypothetical protein
MHSCPILIIDQVERTSALAVFSRQRSTSTSGTAKRRSGLTNGGAVPAKCSRAQALGNLFFSRPEILPLHRCQSGKLAVDPGCIRVLHVPDVWHFLHNSI